jgi:hypothetical protein
LIIAVIMILDTYVTSAATIADLASATLVLGIVYWLLRDRDDRSASAMLDNKAGQHKKGPQ